MTGPDFIKTNKVLGKGTFAKVRLAIHPNTDEKVAIKTLYKKVYQQYGLSFPPRELAIMKCISHPNIVQLYEIIPLEDRIHVVMEYIEGRSLADLIPEDGIEERFARRIFREIITAVEYLHSNNIAHRDLKLDNILLNHASLKLSSQAMIKIIDFGLSTSFVDHQTLCTFCGTEEYAAPEVIGAVPYSGDKVDIWSLGVILFTMVCGDFPFASHFDTLEGRFRFKSSLSSSCRDLLQKIFVQDPQKRVSLSGIISHPWVNEGYSSLIQQPNLKVSLDPNILSIMIRMGYDRPEVSIQELGPATTLYYLLKKKYPSHSFVDDFDSHQKQLCAIS